MAARGTNQGTEVQPAGSDRRQAERFHAALRLAISRTTPSGNGLVVAPAAVHNISRCGALVATRHDLGPSESIDLSIPTDQCPDSMGLPQAFVGSAEVVRIQAKMGQGTLAALQFSSALSHNREFAQFMDFLRQIGERHSSEFEPTLDAY